MYINISKICKKQNYDFVILTKYIQSSRNELHSYKLLSYQKITRFIRKRIFHLFPANKFFALKNWALDTFQLLKCTTSCKNVRNEYSPIYSKTNNRSYTDKQ